jgi:hypothetical protein
VAGKGGEMITLEEVLNYIEERLTMAQLNAQLICGHDWDEGFYMGKIHVWEEIREKIKEG